MLRVPTLLRGLRIVGLAGLNTNNLMPADFLIEEPLTATVRIL